MLGTGIVPSCWNSSKQDLDDFEQVMSSFCSTMVESHQHTEENRQQKCVAYGCRSGANIKANEDRCSRESLTIFRFPVRKEDLLRRCVNFAKR